MEAVRTKWCVSFRIEDIAISNINLLYHLCFNTFQSTYKEIAEAVYMPPPLPVK